MNLLRFATRAYLASLRAFPRRHRDAYDAEMIDTFDHELAARRRRGRAAALWFAAAACLNVVAAGLGERSRYRRTGLTDVAMSWLDFKLAWRMIVRYPGLSAVSTFGLAVGIAIAATAFTVVSTMLNPVVSLPEGDRVIAIVTVDAATTNAERRMIHDLTAWRALASIEDLGASVTVGRTLVAEGGQPETVAVAQMTASGFRVARVLPERGRYLIAEDERPDAPDVMVIGYDVWERRFSGDPAILGRTIQLGRTTHTIVGVMPEGFGFPINHGYWIPWRLDPASYAPRTGPSIEVFARLASGATLESAQAEMAPLGQRMANELPATHQHLRPTIAPYTWAFSGMAEPGNALALRAIQLIIVMLLVVVCVNVAILVYARTATRTGEIAVRTALGASRRRIVAQLFAEALVLAAAAAGAGLLAASVASVQLRGALAQMNGLGLPFWMTFRPSADVVVSVGGLAILSAGIIGVAPALKATGRRLQGRLQDLSAGSGSRMQMGRLWTLLIVSQVAFAVALLPAAMYYAYETLRHRTGDRGFASRDFLSTRIAIDQPPDGLPVSDRDLRTAYAAAQGELERRLESEPGIAAVTFSLANPGEERAAVLEAEGIPAPIELVDYNIVEGTKQGHLVRFNRVAVDFFAAFEVPLLMGRGLRAGDDGVLVNRALADGLFAGANPLGRRVRYVGRSREAGENSLELNRWYDIVGVVPDFPAARTLDFPSGSRLYHAAAAGEIIGPTLSLRVRGAAPSTFTGRLREIAAAVDPGLQLLAVASFEDEVKREEGMMRLIGLTLALVMLAVVALSAAGIYALMSFTVARRRREIGIRAALGANPARLLAGIFARAAAQLGLGAAAGLLGAVALEGVLEGEMFSGAGAIILPAVAVFMTLVGLLATIGPARRGLNIHPTEALREE